MSAPASSPHVPSSRRVKPGIGALMDFLENNLGVSSCAGEKELLIRCATTPNAPKERKSEAPGKSVPQSIYSLPNARLRVQHHFDLEVDLLIVDPWLASVGLVQIIESADNEGDGVATQANLLIDHASYFQHLLMAARQEEESHNHRTDEKIDPALELVLLVRREALEAVSHTLRETLAQSDLLDGMGINILPFEENGDFVSFDKDSQWQAFAWLLSRTRCWYEEQNIMSRPEARRLNMLSLHHFRLGGDRSLKLDERARIHLIHGQNGSGKSTVAEALELATTGRLRRLAKNPSEYDMVLKNRAITNDVARVQIEFAERGDGFKQEIITTGIAKPLDPNLDGMSVVLDQMAMSELSTAEPDRRAAAFLSAFFPGEYAELNRYRLAEKAAQESFSALPTTLQAGLTTAIEPDRMDRIPTERHGQIEERFGWVRTDTVPADAFAECLPLRRAVLTALSPLMGESWQKISPWFGTPPLKSELATALKDVDEALAPLRNQPSSRLDSLARAVVALRTIRDWRAGSSRTDGPPFPTKLNRWLELTALHDLAEKEVQAVETFRQAQTAKWDVPSEAARVLVDRKLGTGDLEVQLEVLRQAAHEWRSLRDELYSKVVAARSSSGEDGNPSTKEIRLDRKSVADLNEVGNWVFPMAASRVGLGDALFQSIEENRAVAWGAVVIGEDDLSITLLSPLEDVLVAYRELEETNRGAQWVTGSQRLDLIGELVRSHAELLAAGKAVQTSLLKNLESGENDSLAQALTELTYLFTPARWAYQKVAISLDTGAGNNRKVATMGLHSPDDAQLALRLNTAELYSLTLALFLLLARRVNNPLQLLVLDDPFQNMDEMTVAAVCRGIRRLLRLWPEDKWQLLVLLHRETDAQRFVQEVPCASYQLPWLSPNDVESHPISIESNSSRQASRMFDISKIMAPIPHR